VETSALLLAPSRVAPLDRNRVRILGARFPGLRMQSEIYVLRVTEKGLYDYCMTKTPHVDASRALPPCLSRTMLFLPLPPSSLGMEVRASCRGTLPFPENETRGSIEISSNDG